MATPRLYKELSANQWPIVYNDTYNISFFGLEKVHPFDSGKWGRIIGLLTADGMLKDNYVRAEEAKREDLRVVHTESYLNSLKWSYQVAKITEVPPVAILPNPVVQARVLKPFRFQTGGTILAARIAVDHGWAMNIGGGFHHCCAEQGGGFCAYADITLAIKFLFQLVPDRIKKAMIVDLDAHQGNGHERDFTGDERVFILDVYNHRIYPRDRVAKLGISRGVPLEPYTDDAVYLREMHRNLRESLDTFEPDIVVYNAGTDILEGDPLGALSITANGVTKRDEIVFSEFRRGRQIPIVMVTSGGYQRSNARVITNSILNLREKGLIDLPSAPTA